MALRVALVALGIFLALSVTPDDITRNLMQIGLLFAIAIYGIPCVLAVAALCVG